MSTVCSPRTTSGRMPSGMRWRSSGGSRFSHSVRGTTPNIAPPSSAKKPSDSETSSRSPNASRAGPRKSGTVGVWPARAPGAGCFSSTSTPCGGRRMHERDQRPFGAGTRRLVDQPDAGRLQLGQRRVDVIDRERHVMQPGAALLEELRDRRLGRGGLEQFEQAFTGRQEVRAHLLAGDELVVRRPAARAVAVERGRRGRIATAMPT